jgi:predicted ABC-type transport system involved in lysophospholipase L1 biosynthesis ATPase subunit
MSNVMLEFDRVEKAYGGLRPLRIRELTLSRGQKLALLGFDRAMAEVFVDLATGATLPESGEVRAFGQHTAAIADAEAWLATLDRFGIVSERAVLLDALTALQNVAMPLTLEVEPLAESIRVEVTRVAAEAGIEGGDLMRPVGTLSPAARLRVRLGRALAPNPLVLLSEHPNALLPIDDVPAFAADFAKIIEARGLASVTLTADRTLAAAVADEVLTLQPATGELKSASGWRRWFAGR